jgi:hypothetical protein
MFDAQDDERAYKAQYRSLAQRFGPFTDGVSRSYAAGAAMQWVRFKQAARRATLDQKQRESGRGSRPSASAVERLKRREGLAWQSYDMAVRRLEEIVKARPRTSTLAQLLAGDTGDRRR